ncbi:LOW QUALITY PROTEIN: MHC class I polypeptide-related sequence A-like [Hipposideros larvatus]
MGVCGFQHRGDPDSASTGRHGGEQVGTPVAEVPLLGGEGTGTQGHSDWRSLLGGTGSHSLQETLSCEIQEDTAPGLQACLLSRELLLSCHWKSGGWTAPQASAQISMETRKSRDTDGSPSKDSWPVCRASFVEEWSSPRCEHDPQAGLGGHGHPDVLGFRRLSQNISVTWLHDEEPLSQDTQQSGGVLLDDGTYQTWMTIRVPQGEEQRFTCYREHSGNHSATLSLWRTWGDPGGGSDPGKALVIRIAGQLFWECCCCSCCHRHSLCPLVQEGDTTGCREPRAR